MLMKTYISLVISLLLKTSDSVIEEMKKLFKVKLVLG